MLLKPQDFFVQSELRKTFFSAKIVPLITVEIFHIYIQACRNRGGWGLQPLRFFLKLTFYQLTMLVKKK